MRGRAAIASVLALAGALLARRRRRRRVRSAPAPLTAPSTASPAPVAPLAPPAPAPEPLLRPAPPSPFASVPWELVEAPDDRAQLTLSYAADAHIELDRVDAQETPTQVFVTVLARWQPPAGGWFAFVEQREATVSLSAPLGARELIHAPTDLDPPARAGGHPSGPQLYS